MYSFEKLVVNKGKKGNAAGEGCPTFLGLLPLFTTMFMKGGSK